MRAFRATRVAAPCRDSVVKTRHVVVLLSLVGLVGAGVWGVVAQITAPDVRITVDEATDPASPRFEPSEVLRETFRSQADPYNSPDGQSCDVWLTGWGTDAPIEEVVAAYEAIGFGVQGRPGTVDDEGNFDPDGELIRWVGTRGDDENEWRKVDIATGAVAGRPEWATAVAVLAPACDE